MKIEDVAWLAGLLEGEGSFMMSRSTVAGKVYYYPKIVVCMTDKDVVERAALLLSNNSVYRVPLSKNGVSKKLQYRAQVSGIKAALLMKELLPLMGERRSAKIQEVLDAYENGS